MNKLSKVVKQFEELINVVEKNETYKSIISEIPAGLIDFFPEKSQMKYKSIYVDMRINGNTKKKSLDLANRLMLRTIRKSSEITPVLIEMQKALLSIHTRIKKGEFFQDSEDAENQAVREEIPVIDATKQEELGGELE